MGYGSGSIPCIIESCFEQKEESVMKKPDISKMTLRQKVGQTGMPAPNVVGDGVKRCGGYAEYFKAFPFSGLYCHGNMQDANGNKLETPEALYNELKKAHEEADIPLLVSCDAEYGALALFDNLHRIPTMMSVGAADSKELAYQRSNLWARELKSCGINWPFGPVGDLAGNFFSQGTIRCLSDDPDVVVKLYPDVIHGIQGAGLAATAKHFPSGGKDYRDAHFCSSKNYVSLEEWNKTSRKVWQAAVDAGVDSFMVGHSAFLAVDPSYARGKVARPASASKKVLDILRVEMNFDGVIVTDAVSMKGVAAAFEHEDVYIECFNAGNDIILFCHDDYIDVMEKAVLDGRVTMERLDESVRRVLALKEKLGLFDKIERGPDLSEEENKIFDEVNYEIACQALTLINNENNMIPFDPAKVKSATIIALAPHAPFVDELQSMVKVLENRGIKTNLINRLRSKEELKQISETNDIIIYACYLAQSQPIGYSFYSKSEDLNTLFHGLSYGASKSVVVSFGAPSIYYNYFEEADAYINAYSGDAGTMKAFVDGILGDFEFTGKSPVKLRPEFK